MNVRKKNSGLTSEIRIKRCYGCGAILQSSDKTNTGFIPKDKIEMEDEQLCERCFKLRHYNSSETPHFNEDFASILARAKKEHALIVYVLDIFAFEASLLSEIDKHLPSKVLVILNKRDVLPKSLSDEKLAEQAASRLKTLNINPLEILIISSLKNYNLDLLMEKIDALRLGNDVYFIGASQVGKSSIINSILKIYKNKTDKFITTSIYPGTTLDVIQIPIDNKSYIYDTPGIYNGLSILNNVERQILKYIIPRSEINPKVYQCQAEQSLILGAIARLDFVKGTKTNFTLLISNEIIVTRTKLDKASRTFDSLIITKNTTPISTTIKQIKDLAEHKLTLPEKGDVEILIVGLGTISTVASGQELVVYAPKNVAVKLMTKRW